SRIHNLKSGYGGLVDIEFLVQALQLHHGSENLSVRTANTTDAIRRLNGYGHLSNEDADFLLESYRFLRFVEDRLQIVENRPLNALPDDQDALDKLARRLGYDSTDDTRPSDRFLDDYHALTDRVRNLFSNGFRRLGVEVE
ncbi:MAG: glutamate-ammonia-ligase adenylyltransferase, partial [Candidatus Poribacteria bacterium]|nr:glutamate-ammonia-ligase adenylyltransferase [Candidatus Poribacteria bacterium]